MCTRVSIIESTIYKSCNDPKKVLGPSPVAHVISVLGVERFLFVFMG
jgi:hypothetical protein